MCGICGLVTANGDRPDPDVVRRMSARLVHRGPDSDGLHAEGPVALAARRLSIIDLEGGTQPIANEDGTVVVVQNGEIYNYRELRRELERSGHRFATASDTEVLVHMYEEHGDEFVGRLRGMFAIAVWDSRASRLLLARDRFGIKPLFYRLADGTLSFASELKAMLEQPGFSRRDRPPCRRRVPDLQLGPGADDDLRRGPEAAGGLARSHGETARSRSGATPGRARPRRAMSAAGRRVSSPMSCARRSATRSAPTSSPTSRSASCSPEGSTRRG